jgi:hypothetical protein
VAWYNFYDQFDVFNDKLKYRDMADWSLLPLEKLGIFQDPNDENQLFFNVESGGYGDILRTLYYAEQITIKTGKKCKVNFITMNQTRRCNIDSKSDDTTVLWDWQEDRKLVQGAISEYNISDKVTFALVHADESEFSKFQHTYTLILGFQRALAATLFFGWPQLDPKREAEYGDYIAAWTTEKNYTPKSPDKDPTGWEEQETYLKILEENGHTVKRISYRDDPEVVFSTIAGAKLCIGYEGFGQVISRSFYKPLITFSQNEVHSRMSGGQWSLIANRVTPILLDVENIILQQKYHILKLTDDWKCHGGLSEEEIAEFSAIEPNME